MGGGERETLMHSTFGPQEALEQGEQLVTNAKMKVMEQDDEIKKLNEYILNAKCHAIRDVQLQEKEEMGVAMSSEEARLDTMMEIDRVKAIQEYEQRGYNFYLTKDHFNTLFHCPPQPQRTRDKFSDLSEYHRIGRRGRGCVAPFRQHDEVWRLALSPPPPLLPPSSLSLGNRGAEVIQKQILEREQQRLIEAERKEQETQAMLQYLERLQVEDMQSMQKKKDTQKVLMEEVAKCNEVCPPLYPAYHAY